MKPTKAFLNSINKSQRPKFTESFNIEHEDPDESKLAESQRLSRSPLRPATTYYLQPQQQQRPSNPTTRSKSRNASLIYDSQSANSALNSVHKLRQQKLYKYNQNKYLTKNKVSTVDA